jgi:hypothetical protein
MQLKQPLTMNRPSTMPVRQTLLSASSLPRKEADRDVCLTGSWPQLARGNWLELSMNRHSRGDVITGSGGVSPPATRHQEHCAAARRRRSQPGFMERKSLKC